MIRRIAVVTSGDDTPGMNAAIRAVTRSALARGWEVLGVRHGYTGLINGEFVPLTARGVGGIIQRGGTILGTIASQEFMTEAGRNTALGRLAEHAVDALVVIGGDGSQAGAYALSKLGYPVNGVASSIDNDLVGSDIAIGVDTAMNITLEAIDHLKITTSSRHCAFLVEVAGRKCGYLALTAGIAGGAEAIVIPEVATTPEQVADAIRTAYERGKSHAIIVVAEGAAYPAASLADYFARSAPREFELQTTTLSHIQRGGAPTGFDRLLGTRLGVCAVDALARGEYAVLAGLLCGQVRTTPLGEVVGKTRTLDMNLVHVSDVLTL
jgi:6-phosphofructokinase 1